MINRFETAIKRGLANVRKAAGITVTYHRGENSVELDVSRLQTPFFQYNAAGVRLRFERVDFGINVADLVLDSEAVEPQDGDIIRIIDSNENTIEYSVRGIDQEPCWRYSDTGRTQYRVHAELYEVTT